MSKERLEEIEGKYSVLTIASKQGGIEHTEVEVEDLVFLIQNGFKQAERIQELEEELLTCNRNYKDEFDKVNFLFEKNNKRREVTKRYCEAINNINEKAMLFGADDQVYQAIQDAIELLEDEK